jgi:hypothetical protein
MNCAEDQNPQAVVDSAKDIYLFCAQNLEAVVVSAEDIHLFCAQSLPGVSTDLLIYRQTNITFD